MAKSREAPLTGPLGEAPPGASLVLASIDIAWAAWLLVCVAIGLAHAGVDDASRDTAAVDASSWSGPLHGTVETTVILSIVFVPILLLISIASLVKVQVRSQPPIFRVLLSGTITLTLVPLASCMLGKAFG